MVENFEYLTDIDQLKERFVAQVLIDSIFDADLMLTTTNTHYGLVVRKTFTIEEVQKRFEKVSGYLV